MNWQEKKYWKLRASLEELLRVEDEDVTKNPLLNEFLDIFAKLALNYQTHGAEAMYEQTKFEMLKEKGVAILHPKKKP
jgi:hypothetical protein